MNEGEGGRKRGKEGSREREEGRKVGAREGEERKKGGREERKEEHVYLSTGPMPLEIYSVKSQQIYNINRTT